MWFIFIIFALWIEYYKSVSDIIERKKYINIYQLNQIMVFHYLLNYTEYIKYKQEGIYDEDIIIKTLCKVCEINNKTIIIKGNNTEGEYPVYGSIRAIITINIFNYEGFNILIGRFALLLKNVIYT